MDPYEPAALYAGPPLVELGRRARNRTLRRSVTYSSRTPTVSAEQEGQLLPFLRWPTAAPSGQTLVHLLLLRSSGPAHGPGRQFLLAFGAKAD
jgi:hypothetical protein